MLREYRTLLPLARRYRWWYAGGLIFLLLTDAGQLFIPQIIRRVVDQLASGTFSTADVGRDVLLLVSVAVVVAAGRFGWRFFIHGASRRIEYLLRDKLFRHLMDLSSSFYGSYKTGDIMARFTNDMRAIRMAAGMAIVAFIDGLFITIAILTILLSQYPSTAWIVVLPLPVVTILVIGAGKLLGTRFKRVQEGFSSLSDFVQETLSGIRVVKSFARERHSLERFADINRDYRRRNMQLIRIWGFLFPLVTFLAGVSTLLLLQFGGTGVILGNFSVGDFTAMLSYLQMLVWPMMGAGFTVNFLQRGAASLGRINAILNERPDITNCEDPERRKPAGSITAEDVSFTYPGSEVPALDGINFSVPAGGALGVIGRVGSGKSTLVRLLPRLIEPQDGRISIDGRDIRDYELKSLRSTFGVVPQRSFLFSVSIRDNIAFGVRTPDEDELRAYADMSTISRDFNQFPLGWDTQVGERGVTLSGGQKQRLAISRAFAVKPGILIFDDALSAVDADTEEKILKAFLDEQEGRTMIIVSNRVSSLKWTDRIIVLDDGRIIQEGRHDDLLSRDGFYRDIARLQGVIVPGGGESDNE